MGKKNRGPSDLSFRGIRHFQARLAVSAAQMGLFSPLRRKQGARSGNSPVHAGNEGTPLLSAFDGTRRVTVSLAPRMVLQRTTRRSDFRNPRSECRRCGRRYPSQARTTRLVRVSRPRFPLRPLRFLATAASSRDPFLDNCKFALIVLIAIGHGLQWLLAQEDSRTARGWCAVEGVHETTAGAFQASSWAILPLRAFYVWSNSIAIPMFAVLSGRVSRSFAACFAPEASAERRASTPLRIKKTVQSLVVPFLTFQLLACAVEAASPDLSDALAPRPPPSATFASAVSGKKALLFDGEATAAIAALNPSRAFNFWNPHLSWYLLALASWRAVLPAAALMQPGAALSLALALGVGIGISNVGYGVGFFLKFGTIWGNFPYFLAGVFLLSDEAYVAFRDDWGSAGRRLVLSLVTSMALIACFFALRTGEMCFDAWQWEAWKSAPYRDYLFVHLSAPNGASGWDLGETFAAPLFRLATYFGSFALGVAFLGTLPRVETPVVTKMGAKTVYAYLLHAPLLLAVFAGSGIFAEAASGAGLGGSLEIVFGILVPGAVTVLCMTPPFVFAFRWLCEPEFGNWLWRDEEPSAAGSVGEKTEG